jgi:S-adenosylmethionine hydrolase
VGGKPVAIVRIGDVTIKGLVNTFGDAQVGELVALWDSDGTLGISVVNGNAEKYLGLGLGTGVKIIFED